MYVEAPVVSFRNLDIFLPLELPVEVIQYIISLRRMKLFPILDVAHLSFELGVREDVLYNIMYGSSKFYRVYNLRNNSKKSRTISAPLPTLMHIQKELNKGFFSRFELDDAATAYRVGTNISCNARPHVGQDSILCIDFRDFFGSIKGWRIRNLLIDLGYTWQVSEAIARLTTLNGSLPQGAPTSPIISNILLRDFDENLSVFCAKRDLRFTRYADDIAISGDSIQVSAILKEVGRLAATIGLEINGSKTKLLKNGSKKKITGVVVNEHLNSDRRLRKRIRQEIYYIQRFGINGHLSEIGETRSNYLRHLLGQIDFVLSITDTVQFRNYKEILTNL